MRRRGKPSCGTVSLGGQSRPGGAWTTFREYAERWRETRQITQALDYRRHLDSRLRNHHYPHFGERPIRAITVTDILEWHAMLLHKPRRPVVGPDVRTSTCSTRS